VRHPLTATQMGDARYRTHCGMGRLFGSYADGRGIELRAFTTLESANAWVQG